MLLPRPRSVTPAPGPAFVLTPDLGIAGPPREAAAVRRLLGPGSGLDLPADPGGALRVETDPALPAEGYRLEVTPAGIAVAAADLAGVNWATQTLRQLLPAAVLRPAPSGEPLAVDPVSVTDAPAFAWRGVHVDVARHFLPLADLFRLVDLVALHKHNVLHLHLTDDQGWRFASRRHPRLAEVASWRRETRRHYETEGDGTPHGGCYTPDQLRAVVAYAADRAVTVVPELEFPGHVVALLAAYPGLGADPARRLEPATAFGIFDEVLHLSDATMAVVLDLYDELLEVFPSPWVHVGGDECRQTEWLANPAAAELARERGLAGPHELQRWFTEQLRDWLADRGRVLVGWDEISDRGPVPGTVVMAWRGSAYARQAVEAGLATVLAPLSHTYFDFYASDDDREPYAIGGLTPVETVYALDPLAGIPAERQHLVLGTQCQLWTEYVPSTRRLDYLLFPRACAHAEVAWSSPEGRSWAEFRTRLEAHLERLDALGVDYRPLEGPRPWQEGGTGRERRPDAHRGPDADLMNTRLRGGRAGSADCVDT